MLYMVDHLIAYARANQRNAPDFSAHAQAFWRYACMFLAKHIIWKGPVAPGGDAPARPPHSRLSGDGERRKHMFPSRSLSPVSGVRERDKEVLLQSGGHR